MAMAVGTQYPEGLITENTRTTIMAHLQQVLLDQDIRGPKEK